MALTGLAIAAGLSLAKSKLVDQPAYDKQKQLAANTQRLSPWTGNKAQAPTPPNWAGQLMQYGATGAAMGSNYAKGATPAGDAAGSNTFATMNPYNSASPGVAPVSGMNYAQDPYGFFGVSKNPMQP